MPSLPLHPALVHLPLGLAFVLPLVALGLTFAAFRGRWSRGGWAVLVAMLAATVGGGMASMQTGEQQEDAVERVVPKRLIHEHEERAEAFLWTSIAVLAVAIGALAIKRDGPRKALAGVATAGTLAIAGLAVWTGHSGGELVYVHGAASAYTSPSAAAPAAAGRAGHAEEDDD